MAGTASVSYLVKDPSVTEITLRIDVCAVNMGPGGNSWKLNKL